MKIHTSRRDSKASEAFGSNVPERDKDSEVHERSSAQSQVGGQNDCPSNSGDSGESEQSANLAANDTNFSVTTLPIPSAMPRMIGDFNDNANSMWSLHLDEAKSHDEARIHSLKDDMEGVLIFAGLFSAALTSFLIDSVSNLQVDPAQQMVFYQQQNVALLAQISHQISAIAPQVSITLTPLPSYNFSPSASDVRVNAFWFMSLVFSLSAALLATLVQQWVRDYMHVFQRYSNPLKSTRLRQYLYEGVEGWYMPRVARFVPGFVHISLFLFFAGLVDSLLATYTTVGITTIIPIAICSSLYVFSTFAPVINPQSPFRNPFSGLIWYLRQKVHPRRYLDRASGGSLKAVSANMSEGQMQLAMEENHERKGRDVRAIQWLIHNRTEDDEMESFTMAIPGAFTSMWGIDIWRNVAEVTQYENTNLTSNEPTDGSQSDTDLPISILPQRRPPLLQDICRPLSILHPLGRIIGIRITNGTPRDATVTRSMPRLPSNDQAYYDIDAHGDLAIFDLCKRVRHLIETCDNHSVFTNHGLWFNRARGCVETVASLVLCADINPALFGDFGRLLSPLSKFVEVGEGRQPAAPGSDGLFFARWTCLSFLTVYRRAANHDKLQSNARVAIKSLSRFGMGDGNEQTINGEDDNDEAALRNAQRIDDYFESAMQLCVYQLREAFRPSEAEATEDQAREVLARDHEVNICMLERIVLTVDHIENIDLAIHRINELIYDLGMGLTSAISGSHHDFIENTEPLQPAQFFGSTDLLPKFLPQFIFLHQRLQLLCSYSSQLRDIIDGRGDDTYQEILDSLGTLWDESDNRYWSVVHRRHLMERQLWRLQDLRDGGGFGFWVESMFLVIEQLGLIPLSPDAFSSLILGMFRAVTSHWRQHKHYIGTQRVILNLVCDLSIDERGPLSNCTLPTFIIDELLILLEKILEGQSGSHIDEVMKEMEDEEEQDAVTGPTQWTDKRLFRAKVLKVVSRLRASANLPLIRMRDSHQDHRSVITVL
ncbi:hypothetical protein V8E53_008340 [Lactarius tabidus]